MVTLVRNEVIGGKVNEIEEGVLPSEKMKLSQTKTKKLWRIFYEISNSGR